MFIPDCEHELPRLPHCAEQLVDVVNHPVSLQGEKDQPTEDHADQPYLVGFLLADSSEELLA